MSLNFEDLNLNPLILKAIAEAGYSTPTQIQAEAIPHILAGCDLRASAQTGTGKTAAFLLPALNRMAATAQKGGKGPRLLVIAPTRELAMQIASEAEKYAKYLPRMKTVCIGGGVPYPAQLRKLATPYEILVATPGRLIDFLDRGKISFSRLEMLVLDEADRMLDMGFVEPVEQIVAATPASRQTLLFSATMQGSVMKLSQRLLKNPHDIVIHAEHAKHDNIKQYLHYVDDLNHKNRLLHHILGNKEVEYSIIFTATKRHAELLATHLHDNGHRAAPLHGDMNQRQRTRTIMQLRDGKINILVATDVAARGIDVKSITHVINFDLPQSHEDYVHRIGRTGRAGSEGVAFSFASAKESPLVRRIEEFTGQKIAVVEVAGLEPSRTKPKKKFAKAKPFRRRKSLSRR